MLPSLWFRVARFIWYVIFRMTGRRVATKLNVPEIARTMAGFLAPLDLVARRLPSSQFRPVEYAPGKCVVTVGSFEVRRARSILPYNEIGVEVPVIFTGDDGTETQGGYVFWLPVTKEESRWGGVAIYGLPKFLADIQFIDQDGWRTTVLREGGKEILRLEVPELPTSPVTEDRYYLSTIGPTILRTLMRFTGSGGQRRDGCCARLHLGDHPISQQLRELSLETVPVFEEYAYPLGFVLHEPEAVGRLSAPGGEGRRMRSSA